jgi:hypothetical protein
MNNVDPKELAKWMHIHYEMISKKKGWITQESCQVEYESLPKENKEVMEELAKRLTGMFSVTHKVTSNQSIH